jgi:PQQ-dependent catabolism-associated CXXCW motif protein
LIVVGLSSLYSRAIAGNESTEKIDAEQHWLKAYQDNEELFTLDGYRLFRYRSPTPKHAKGGITIDTSELVSMLNSNHPPALLDVQPVSWNSVFILTKPRQHIPGSTWIPNVGMGELEEGWEDYFRHHLQKVTHGNKQFPVVIYCRADCWMSWNAVMRAAEWGYSSLYWYRNGTDAWREHEFEMDDAVPKLYPHEVE